MKIIPFKKVFNLSLKGALVLFALFSAPHFSYAQEQATEQTPEQVIEIKAKHEGMMPYQELYEYAKKTQSLTQGHVAFIIQLKPLKPDVKMDDIRLWLESKSKSISIKILDGNLFIVPVDDEIATEKGQFSVNKQKGEIQGIGNWIPNVPKNDWTIGLTKQVIDESNTAIKKVMPWYSIPFLPKIKSIAVCTKQAGVEVQIKDGDNIVASVTTKDADKNDSNQPVFCTYFDKNTTYKDDLRIVIPDTAEVIFK